MASHGDDAIEWDMGGRPISTTVGGETRDFVYFGGRVSSDPETDVLGRLDLGPIAIGFDPTAAELFQRCVDRDAPGSP